MAYLTLTQGSVQFTEEDLDPRTIDFDRNGHDTPDLVYGTHQTVYWRQCEKVDLVQKVRGELKTIRTITKETGKGVLPVGLALKFLGPGGRIVEV